MLHTFPTDVQIVEAVREWLLTEVVGGADPGLAFQARVAANLLGALERELEQGPEVGRLLDEALASLGARDEDDLALRVRSGERAADPALLGVLRAVTEARVRTWNPRHLEPVTDDDPRAAPRD